MLPLMKGEEVEESYVGAAAAHGSVVRCTVLYLISKASNQAGEVESERSRAESKQSSRSNKYARLQQATKRPRREAGKHLQ